MKRIEITMRSRNWVCLMVLMFFISGCAGPPTTSQKAPATRTQILPSKTATPLISPDFPPPVVPTSTLTPTLLPTKIPTNTLTITPRPTLSIEEAKTLILELVQKHENCQLPCLWGFVPGENDLEKAQAFVRQFGLGDFRIGDIELGAHDYGDVGGVGIAYKKNGTTIIIHWSYYQSGTTSKLELLTLSLRSMEILGIDPINQLPILSPVYGDRVFNMELHDYLLPSILAAYGQPKQVLLTVLPDEPDSPYMNWHPFSVAIIYPDKGLYIEFEMSRQTLGGNYCARLDSSHISLATWDPKHEMSLEYIVEKAGLSITARNHKSIEEATSLSVEDFYKVFRDPENITCLETPMKIWSGE